MPSYGAGEENGRQGPGRALGMEDFIAIVLICQMSMPQDACTEVTARDVMSIHVDSELACSSGWQDVVARSAFADDVGKTAYVETKGPLGNN
jgi:hypothetical protein